MTVIILLILAVTIGNEKKKTRQFFTSFENLKMAAWDWWE